MPTPTCRFCHEEIEEGAKQCPACGERQSRTRAIKGDRSGWLKVMGVIHLLLGALVALFLPCVIFGAVVQAQTQPQMAQPLSSTLVTLVVYGGIAGFLFWTGLGAIRCRRWVPPLMVALMTPVLVIGVLVVAMMPFVMPDFGEVMKSATPPGSTGPPAGIGVLFLVGVMVMCFVIYIAIPGLFVLFYRNREVQQTCHRMDPAPRWTDRCPTSVLAVSLWQGIGAIALASSAFAYTAFPVGGVLLTGAPAALCLLGIALLLVFLSWANYRLWPVGLWGTFALTVGGGISNVCTLSQVDILDLYRAQKMSDEQLRLMEQMDMPSMMPAMIVMSAVTTVVVATYLLAIRHHFRAVSTPALSPSDGLPSPSAEPSPPHGDA